MPAVLSLPTHDATDRLVSMGISRFVVVSHRQRSVGTLLGVFAWKRQERRANVPSTYLGLELVRFG